MAGLDRRGCFEHHKNTETGFCLYIGTSMGAISLSRSLFPSAFAAGNNLLTF